MEGHKAILCTQSTQFADVCEQQQNIKKRRGQETCQITSVNLDGEDPEIVAIMLQHLYQLGLTDHPSTCEHCDDESNEQDNENEDDADNAQVSVAGQRNENVQDNVDSQAPANAMTVAVQVFMLADKYDVKSLHHKAAHDFNHFALLRSGGQENDFGWRSDDFAFAIRKLYEIEPDKDSRMKKPVLEQVQLHANALFHEPGDVFSEFRKVARTMPVFSSDLAILMTGPYEPPRKSYRKYGPARKRADSYPSEH